MSNRYNNNNNKNYSNNFNRTEYNDESVSSFLMNKIMGAYKNTKESPYVKSIYQETSNAFSSSPKNTINDSIDSIPENTRITLYPTYCKHDNGEYITRVKGIVTAIGLMSRKNKFLLSMARRISGPNNDSSDINNSVDQVQLQNEFQHAITDQDTYNPRDDESTISSNTSINLPNDLVKTRMEGILAKTIPGISLNVTIGSDKPVDKLLGATLSTDNFGMFDISVVTPYKPSYIAVSSIQDPSILQTISLEVIEPNGVSIITDIDDTIRLTGVLGDKREVFRNIFAKPYTSCEIKGVVSWFQELHEVYKCPIHYVSNSPWQVFNVVNGFMSYFNFPISSVHLRQYSGNLLTSFTQPSAERKRPSLVSLLQDFPDRKFILIGDTGEQDLEAYLSLIPNYAPQIMAIYLRVVPTSLSSTGNDLSALRELRRMIAQRNKNRANIGNKVKIDKFLKNPTGIDSDDDSDYECSVAHKSWVKQNSKTTNIDTTTINTNGNNNVEPVKRRRSSLDIAKNAINTAANITGVKKLAPIVPKKPLSLRGTQIIKTPLKEANLTNLNRTQVTSDNDICNVDSNITAIVTATTSTASSNNYIKPNYTAQLSKTSSTDIDNDDYMDFSDDSLEYDSIDANGSMVEDKRLNLWRQKIRRVINEVPEHIKVQFWEDTDKVRKESIDLIIKEIK